VTKSVSVNEACSLLPASECVVSKMPRRITLAGSNRSIPSSLLFGLIGVCAVLTVVCGCLISTIALIKKHEYDIERFEMDTVNNSFMNFSNIPKLRVLI